jgi:GGDEF domain-containing protein
MENAPGVSADRGPSADLLIDPLTGFGTRHALMLALDRALEPSAAPSLLVVLGLDGYEEHISHFGRLAGRRLLVKLAARLAHVLEPSGICFRPRDDEFAAVVDTTIDAAKPLLDAAVVALRERATSGAVTAAWGAALLPDEARTPIGALAVADGRLASNAPRRRRRNRRSGLSSR